MNNQKSSPERRKDKRYNLQGGTFAALPSNYLVGQVKNISRRGLAFTYIDLGNQTVNRPVMEIFSKENEFYLREVPFKIVSKTEVRDHISFSSIRMKQIGGEFVDLTENQISQLDYFLQNVAAAEA
jgi:hypothetical protein